MCIFYKKVQMLSLLTEVSYHLTTYICIFTYFCLLFS